LKDAVLAFQTLGKFILYDELLFVAFQKRIHSAIVRTTKDVLVETPLSRERPFLRRRHTFVWKITNTEIHHSLMIGRE
jgi:hypothetical protein